MNHYKINVVASFKPEVDPLGIVAACVRDGLDLEAEASALDIVNHESVMHAVKLQTLTFTYEAEGRDLDEAGAFALAIYQRDAELIGLPEPETLIANEAEE